MDKHGEVRAGETPCVVCGEKSKDGRFCSAHKPQKQDSEKPAPRTLQEHLTEE